MESLLSLAQQIAFDISFWGFLRDTQLRDNGWEIEGLLRKIYERVSCPQLIELLHISSSLICPLVLWSRFFHVTYNSFNLIFFLHENNQITCFPSSKVQHVGVGEVGGGKPDFKVMCTFSTTVSSSQASSALFFVFRRQNSSDTLPWTQSSLFLLPQFKASCIAEMYVSRIVGHKYV